MKSCIKYYEHTNLSSKITTKMIKLLYVLTKYSSWQSYNYKNCQENCTLWFDYLIISQGCDCDNKIKSKYY